VAVIGCCHGELDKIYETCSKIKPAIDLVLITGDFQSIRDEYDLSCMAVPDKYKNMGVFHEYHSGKKVSPILTIFVGGNHEASNYLRELYFGGWVAKNIYFLGFSAVVNVGGLTIGGISGIFNKSDYKKGYFETFPHDLRAAYHTREFEVIKLAKFNGKIDIFLSHDWPQGIEHCGDTNDLLRRKPYFKNDIENGNLGSPLNKYLCEHLKPKYWFSSHLHVKFNAVINHSDGNTTNFLALDKVLPYRKFIHIVDYPSVGEMKLKINLEWINILRKTMKLMPLGNQNVEFSSLCNENELKENEYDGDLNPIDFEEHPSIAKFCSKFDISFPLNSINIY
ncbi:hypothetical protein ROZALSC1DRAFT_26769, partial [Rozella allomycis CSF55]